MKRRIALSITLVLSIVLVSLMSSDSTVQAKNQQATGNTGFATLGLPNNLMSDHRDGPRFTGTITLGQGQILRLTVNGGAGNDTLRVRFSSMVYGQTGCNNGVCKHVIVGAGPGGGPFTIIPGEALSLDITQPPGASGVSGIIELGGSPQGISNARVNAQIINAQTGEVQAIIAILML